MRTAGGGRGGDTGRTDFMTRVTPARESMSWEQRRRQSKLGKFGYSMESTQRLHSVSLLDAASLLPFTTPEASGNIRVWSWSDSKLGLSADTRHGQLSV